MGRALVILLILGALAATVNVRTHGVDRAFGGALARLWKQDSKPGFPAQPVPRERVTESWEERPERPRPLPIGQRVRERVNRALDEGTRRYGGED